MANQPERPGSKPLLFQSYTYWLFLAMLGSVGLFVAADLRSARHIGAATGLKSDLWVCVCLFAGYNVTRWIAGGMSPFVYHRVTGRNPNHDPQGFVEAGGIDVMIWCNLLSISAVLFIFGAAVPAGVFGWARPFVLVIAAAVLSGVVTWAVASALFKFMVAPRRRINTRATTCLYTYLVGGRCGFNQHPGHKYCRWHKVLLEFREDLVNKPWAITGLLVGVAFSFTLAVNSVSAFAPGTEWLCLGMVAFALGSAAKLFADAIIARDYRYSQFATWAILLALGLAVEAVSGYGAASAIFNNPQAALPLIKKLWASPSADRYGPVLLAAFLSLSASFSLYMLLRRVLFYRVPFVGPLVFSPAVGMIGRMVWPLLRYDEPVIPPESRPARGEFWLPVVGDKIWIVTVVWFAGFIVCEVINKRLRQRELSQQGFRDTLWVSYPVCIGAPSIGMAVSRYILVWTGVEGVGPFCVLAVAVAIPVCILGTRWSNRLVGKK